MADRRLAATQQGTDKQVELIADMQGRLIVVPTGTTSNLAPDAFDEWTVTATSSTEDTITYYLDGDAVRAVLITFTDDNKSSIASAEIV